LLRVAADARVTRSDDEPEAPGVAALDVAERGVTRAEGEGVVPGSAGRRMMPSPGLGVVDGAGPDAAAPESTPRCSTSGLAVVEVDGDASRAMTATNPKPAAALNPPAITRAVAAAWGLVDRSVIVVVAVIAWVVSVVVIRIVVMIVAVVAIVIVVVIVGLGWRGIHLHRDLTELGGVAHRRRCRISRHIDRRQQFGHVPGIEGAHR
jgi:hypothetical protein